jgi:hypothetical protein
MVRKGSPGAFTQQNQHAPNCGLFRYRKAAARPLQSYDGGAERLI